MKFSSLLRMALLLGLLSAIGPFAIDMYLPALPAIGHSLGADPGAVQMSLMAFFVSFALGQLFYGPASDMWGRKPPLYFGLALFAVGSVGCALAPSIGTLVALRFVQGLGAGAGAVVPRAIVRDLHTGNEAARLTGLLMLVFSVSPILEPLAGSLLSTAVGWRGIFWAVFGTALLGLVLVGTQLQETRSAAQRAGSSARSALAGYALLLRDGRFMGLTFIGGFGIASFFTYLSNSSFVLIGHYGLTPLQYSLVFAVNAVSFIGGSQLTARLGRRWGLLRVVRVAVAGYALAMVLLCALFLSGAEGLLPMAVLLFVGYGFLGLVMPATAVLAMDAHGAIAGTAAALMGTLQLIAGALAMAAVAPFVDGTARPMLVAIAVCALVAWVLTGLTLGWRGAAARAVAQECAP